MYKYSYLIGPNSNVNIKTDLGAKKFEDIKREEIKKEKCIINKSTYPNGVILEMHQYVDRIEIFSDNQIVKDENGQYIVLV